MRKRKLFKVLKQELKNKPKKSEKLREKRIIDVKELCKLFERRITDRHIRRLIREGELPGEMKNRKYIIKTKDLISILENLDAYEENPKEFVRKLINPQKFVSFPVNELESTPKEVNEKVVFISTGTDKTRTLADWIKNFISMKQVDSDNMERWFYSKPLLLSFFLKK